MKFIKFKIGNKVYIKCGKYKDNFGIINQFDKKFKNVIFRNLSVRLKKKKKNLIVNCKINLFCLSR